MEYKIPATPHDFYYKYLTYIKGMLDLSTKERMVLGEFMKIQEHLVQKEYDTSPFSSDNRKLVQKSLKMSSYSVNNYIKTFRVKRVVIGQEDNLIIHKAIIPKVEEGKYTVAFNFTIT